MRVLGQALRDAIERSGFARTLEERGCLSLWPQVVGEDVARATLAERFRDGVIYVRVRSSVWACELAFFREGFIREINERLGRELVRDIRFRVGEIPTPAPPPDQHPQPTHTEEEACLDAASMARVEEAASAIKSDALRARVRSILIREQARRAKRLEQGWRTCPSCGATHHNDVDLCPLCALKRTSQRHQ